MKSRVLTTINPASVDISEFVRPIPVDEKRLAAEIRRIINPYIRWEKADTLLEGGIAVCRLVSDIARFHQEQVKFVAGSGMFNPKIEGAVIGLGVGESVTASVVDGEVTVTLLEATNRIVPALTDEIAKNADIEGVETAAELRAHLIRKQKEEAIEKRIFDPYYKIKQTVINASEFVIAPVDWHLIVDERLRFLRGLAQLEGFDLENATPEQLTGRMPVRSYHELVCLEQKEAWETLCTYLLGRKYAEEDGYAPGEADFDAMIADYCSAWNMREADARRIHSRTSFDISSYAGHASERYFAIIREKMLKEA